MLAYFVHLLFPRDGIVASDNYVHILPGDTVTILVERDEPGPDPPSLRVRTLADVVGR